MKIVRFRKLSTQNLVAYVMSAGLPPSVLLLFFPFIGGLASGLTNRRSERTTDKREIGEGP
jgi:hypothetical protein